jgi:transcriptional regulator with XRE-family HTH domain
MAKAHPKRIHLEAWRKHFRRTLLWLANELGTSHSSLQRAEKGISGVDETTFRAIAAIYGITPAELSVHPSEADKARQLDRIFLRLRHLSPESLKTIAELSEQLPDHDG